MAGDDPSAHLAALILANHVVAATILLNSGPALGTLLRVGRYPVGRLAVVVALFRPLADQRTPHRVVPVLWCKREFWYSLTPFHDIPPPPLPPSFPIMCCNYLQ